MPDKEVTNCPYLNGEPCSYEYNCEICNKKVGVMPLVKNPFDYKEDVPMAILDWSDEDLARQSGFSKGQLAQHDADLKVLEAKEKEWREKEAEWLEKWVTKGYDRELEAHIASLRQEAGETPGKN